MIVSIFESENQSIFRQNFQYWQFHISTWFIFDFWKFLKYTFVCLANQFDFFRIDNEIVIFRIQISNQFFKFFHIFVQYFSKNSVLKLFFFFETIRKSHQFHLQKIFVFFVSTLNSIFFYQKRQKLFSEILHQHSILILSILSKNFWQFHSFN